MVPCTICTLESLFEVKLVFVWFVFAVCLVFVTVAQRHCLCFLACSVTCRMHLLVVQTYNGGKHRQHRM